MSNRVWVVQWCPDHEPGWITGVYSSLGGAKASRGGEWEPQHNGTHWLSSGPFEGWSIESHIVL